jgi:uncharacterized protein (TIGR00251 family)
LSVILEVKVKPGARVSALAELPDGSWLATLKAPPVDGKANAELVALVAQHFGCRRAQVSIKAGVSGRRKLVSVRSLPRVEGRFRPVSADPR